GVPARRARRGPRSGSPEGRRRGGKERGSWETPFVAGRGRASPGAVCTAQGWGRRPSSGELRVTKGGWSAPPKHAHGFRAGRTATAVGRPSSGTGSGLAAGRAR